MKWANVTDSARRAFNKASRVALDESYPCEAVTLSLLQAILNWKHGRAGLEVLRRCEVNTYELEIAAGEAVRLQVGEPASRESVQTKLSEVVDLARQESENLGVNWVGTEHLVLGLLRKPEEPPARLLASRGVTPELFRTRLAELLGGNK